jgi:hypothetical protein
MWSTLGWPADAQESVASQAELEDDVLTVYYSTVYPPFLTKRNSFEQRDATRTASFVTRYEIWLAVHSLIIRQGETEQSPLARPVPEEAREEFERQERCRIATMAAMFAAREVQELRSAELGTTTD